MNRTLQRLTIFVSAAFWCSMPALAQEQGARTSADPISGQLGLHATAVPLDGPIDETAYIVGPGDLFVVTIATIPPQAMALTITSQGTLVIPMVGEVPAAGKTLASFRDDVLKSVRRRYLSGDPSVSLVSPRRIVVRVRGTGVNEGSYVVSASDRVQTLLARGDVRRTVVRTEVAVREVERELIAISRRSIRILRSGADPIVVDLERYALSRSAEWSPYLQEGDEVIFVAADRARASVTVGGAVMLPASFEWRTGDRVRDLLGFAKGLREHAHPDSIQLLRSSGAIEWHTAASEAPVVPGDRIIVPSRMTPTDEALVNVDGEVRQPGSYPIVSGRTRLAELIALAGGVTGEAMVHATSVYRSAPVGDEQRLLLLTAERGNAALEDTAYVRIETQARLYGERVSMNAAQALADPSCDENVALRPGDRIVVPRRTGTVYVFGQVRRPGLQPFRPGEGLGDYVRRAGGYTERAKDDEVSVIKYASRQWLSPDDATIEEGDMVWVPRVVERDLAYNLGLIGQIAGIVSAAATLILLVTQVGK